MPQATPLSTPRFPAPPSSRFRPSLLRAVKRTLAIILAAALLGACATAEIRPLTEAGSRYGVDRDERSLIKRSNDLEAELRDKGLVVEDAELQRYIDGVGAKVAPPQATEHVRFKFLVLRDPTINAFALLQGTVCVNSGLLARLDNEAQLAHVLAHEITHIVNRHQLKHLRSVKRKTVTAKVIEMAVLPPAVAYGGGGGASVASLVIGLTYAATVSGYSRDLEEEADRQALALVAAAGYDIREAPKLFAKLNEAEDPGALEGFLYSSHPSNSAREHYTRKIVEQGGIAPAGAAAVNAREYREATRSIALRNIRWRIKERHYQFALEEAERMMARWPDEAMLHYLAGEARRRMAEDPEGAAWEQAMRRRERPDDGLIDELGGQAEENLSEAETRFRRALELDPSLVLAHRGLGLVAHQRGDAGTARKELEIYLQKATRLKDRRYISRLLEEPAP